MSFGIRLRALQLRGLNRDYGIAFLNDDGAPQGVGVIAGEISTGKTSILEFVDYCLGASDHPTHPEFVDASVRSALLEIESEDQRYVVERSVFPASGFATVHSCDLEGLALPHRRERRVLRPAGDPRSLSSFLLDRVGLAGVRLKEAPTQAASGSDPMSFRDLMTLCFLPTDRIGSKFLLHENDRMRALKTRQVIEAVFGVHEELLVELSSSLERKTTERDRAQTARTTLRNFLADRQIPEIEWLEASLDRIAQELEALDEARATIDQQLRAQTSVAEDLRREFAAAVQARRSADTRLRDRETLRDRLLALRGQYASDISRMTFYTEAARLFDTLSVVVCPACRSPLPSAPTILDDHCTLCGQVVTPLASEGPINVEHEIKSTKSRLDELARYIAEVDAEIRSLREEVVLRAETEQATRSLLDREAAPAVAPFLTQRDQLAAQQQSLHVERGNLVQGRGLREGLAEQDALLGQLTVEIGDLEARIRDLTKGRRSRDELVLGLSARFAAILADFRFPKLSEAGIRNDYVPFVRGRRYSQLSSGAMTLASVAWQLTVFEAAVEQGQAHPGFLLLDGIGKSLTPPASPAEPEYYRPEIVDRIYDHIIRWARGRDSQVVIVDNRPSTLSRPYQLVYFSGQADQPPYGLIDDAVG